MSYPKQQAPDPKRFEVSKGTLLLDRVMTQVIRFGGLAVILAVFGIFLFIVKEIVPLFAGAEGRPGQVLEHAAEEPRVLGVDEWGELPFLYGGEDRVTLVNAADGSRTELEIPGLKDVNVTATAYDPVNRRVALGLDDGRVGSFVVEYKVEFPAEGVRKVLAEVVEEPWFEAGAGSGPVKAVAYGDGGSSRVLVVAREQGLSVVRLAQKRALVGKPKLAVAGTDDLTGAIEGSVVRVAASQNGQAVLVAEDSGKVRYFQSAAGKVTEVQVFEPFPGTPPLRMDFLFGGVSVAMTREGGEQKIFSLFRQEGSNERTFGETKSFEPLGTGRPVFAPSLRNKTFLTGAGGALTMRHLTSGATRWEGTAPFEPVLAAFDGKSEHFFIAAADGRLQGYRMEDPHPEAGWRAFFGKVWYEGGSGPVYQWQSTGGTDDFEPKLSLIPLIVGSLKGTFYALMFSVPIALLAAIFSASFLPQEMKRVVKPAMEIMASLPSVVLGFLAGIWLAPLVEDRVPSILLLCLSLPVSALLVGLIWCRLPMKSRRLFEGGREWLLLLPVLGTIAAAAWALGPVIEGMLFVYRDPSGREIADFRLWWPQATGLPFDQRNSLVVGFMMGFAVIPVIFTIAEDSLSNVPKTLTAAASALGASRWQVVRTIIIPVASPGIFSALMIGFGRAVGETMIVVMATGNTPVTSWNIFSGMRTLSANIAVELPEAAPGSTHYRTLFLGALVLFLLTFTMNSFAEILRQRLREKNKIV